VCSEVQFWTPVSQNFPAWLANSWKGFCSGTWDRRSIIQETLSHITATFRYRRYTENSWTSRARLKTDPDLRRKAAKTTAGQDFPVPDKLVKDGDRDACRKKTRSIRDAYCQWSVAIGRYLSIQCLTIITACHHRRGPVQCQRLRLFDLVHSIIELFTTGTSILLHRNSRNPNGRLF